MIYVIAAIQLKPGKLPEFLKIIKANADRVRKEDGCIDYVPSVDSATDIPKQKLSPDTVTIIEKWNDLKALYSHRSAPHMLEYKEQVKDLVEKVEMKILREA